MRMGHIYSLNDPISDIPRYIGFSTRVKTRYTLHCNSQEKTHKGNWIRSLKEKGLKPKLDILDEVSVEEIKFWEIYYISLYKSWGFNLVNGTFGGDGTLGLSRIITKEMIAKGLETRIINGSLQRVAQINKESGLNEWARQRMLSDKNPGKKQMKPVLQYSKNGKFIKEFESAAIVEREFGFNANGIGLCCKNKFSTSNGFRWKYKDGEIKQELPLMLNPYIIIQYDLNDSFIKEWDSLSEIEKKLKFFHSNIRLACNGTYKQAYGYKWKCKKDV